jgi:prepilin-type N-terminal cleavage/methylation domain-containing protein
MKLRLKKEKGFTLVEIVLACAIFPLVVAAVTYGYDGIRRTYTISKQLNEMYAVLSACPEIDRALEYDSITSSNNCYPNNSFYAEGGSGNIITYTPTLTVTTTPSLPNTDPLQAVPDSKVIDISVGFQQSAAPPLELRMLVTRNGIGQL